MRTCAWARCFVPFVLIGCSSGTVFPFQEGGASEPEDTGAMMTDLPDSQVIVPSDAGDAAAPSTGFFLLATETPYAPASNGSNWGEIPGFHFSDDYQAAMPGGGLDKKTHGAYLADPLGLAFRWKTAELFVANRGGNLGGQSTITRFPYDNKTQKFGAGATVVSGFTGFHQLAFSKSEDEIFVGTNNEGMRRYKVQNNTWSEVLPQLVGSPHWIRGVAVSPDGKRLYASTAGNVIRQWDLGSNQELAAYPLQDNTASLHFMTVCGPPKGMLTTGCNPPKLFVSDSIQSGQRAIYSFEIDSNDELKNEKKTLSAPTFCVALSPSSKEIFSGGSSANSIQRFKLTNNNAWMLEQSTIMTQNNIGTILVFPENAVPVQPN